MKTFTKSCSVKTILSRELTGPAIPSHTANTAASIRHTIGPGPGSLGFVKCDIGTFAWASLGENDDQHIFVTDDPATICRQSRGHPDHAGFRLFHPPSRQQISYSLLAEWRSRHQGT